MTILTFSGESPRADSKRAALPLPAPRSHLLPTGNAGCGNSGRVCELWVCWSSDSEWWPEDINGTSFFKKTFFFLFSEPLASERQPVRFMIALYQVRSSHTPSQPTLFIAPLDSSLNCSLHAQWFEYFSVGLGSRSIKHFAKDCLEGVSCYNLKNPVLSPQQTHLD